VGGMGPPVPPPLGWVGCGLPPALIARTATGREGEELDPQQSEDMRQK